MTNKRVAEEADGLLRMKHKRLLSQEVMYKG